MWLNIAAKLVPGILKTGMSIASNRRKTKELESVAELKLAERMANGEVEFKKAVIDSHRGDWKDEFCLILISIPLLLLESSNSFSCCLSIRIWSLYSFTKSKLSNINYLGRFIISAPFNP